jgi:hypothetical protein
MQAGIAALIAKMQASSLVSSEFLPVLDTAAIHIAEHDVNAISTDVTKARDIKDRLGTANIEETELVDRLTDALMQCRQETGK